MTDPYLAWGERRHDYEERKNEMDAPDPSVKSPFTILPEQAAEPADVLARILALDLCSAGYIQWNDRERVRCDIRNRLKAMIVKRAEL